MKNGNFYENALFFRIFCYHQHQICGGVPERSNGTDCKSVAFGFDGSNPSPSTRFSVVRLLFLNTPSSVPCFFWLYSVFGHGKFLHLCLCLPYIFRNVFRRPGYYLTKAIKLKRDYCHPGGIPAQYGSIPALVAQSRPRSRSALQTHI